MFPPHILPRVAIVITILCLVAPGYLALAPVSIEPVAWRAPLNRFLEPEEIAHLAVYLGAAESDGITGQSILLDGGTLGGLNDRADSTLRNGGARRKLGPMATVLVVDDDESVRDLVRRYLTNAGYDVVAAEDAIVAGHLVVGGAPDLIVLDVNMPYMDGFEFTAALNADDTIPFIPIIFLTARDEGYDRAMELGAVGYINKPVDAHALVSLVRQHLPEG